MVHKSSGCTDYVSRKRVYTYHRRKEVLGEMCERNGVSVEDVYNGAEVPEFKDWGYYHYGVEMAQPFVPALVRKVLEVI